MFSLLRRAQYDYIPLSSTNSDDKDGENFGLDDGETKLLFNNVFYPAFICMLTALLSIFVLSLKSLHPSTVNLSIYELQSPRRTDLVNLRRPSQFVGLEKINRSSVEHELSVINFPFLVGRVDSEHPKSVVTDGPASRAIFSGVESRKVEMTHSITTVLQFRMLDWKLENCALRIRLPSMNDPRSLFNASSSASEIAVHRLASGSTLRLDSLSHYRIPKLEQKLVSIRVNSDRDTEWTHHFHCAMDSLHTFALVAGNRETSVAWWQDKQVEVPSVHIIQRGI